MNENEAIEIIKKNYPKRCKMVNGNLKGGFIDTDCELGQAFSRAINALEEIQRYRAIGTPEELENIVCGMTEQELYREGYKKGIDECREAVEKQKAKKCNLSGDGYSDGHLVYDTYECPNCGKEYEVEYEEYEYCPNCGQHMKIDWSVEE